MKKIIIVNLILVIALGCDPGDSLEANFLNSSEQDLSVVFSSSEYPHLNQNLFINKKQKKIYVQIDKKGTITNILTFMDFDSIYITNTSNEVLKVYKADTPGKNIYNVDEYWQKREPSKNFFEYTYEITAEDIK